MKKSTIAEMDNRISAVVELISNGYSRPEILQHAAKSWGLATRATDELIARARAEIIEINRETLIETISVLVRNFWKQYRKADQKDDVYGATMVLKEIARVKGLDYQTLVVEDRRELKDLSDVELDKLLEAEQLQ